MKTSTQIQNLLDANQGVIKTDGTVYYYASGTDNLFVVVEGQNCTMYVEGTEPTIKEWVNNFKVNRADFHGLGEMEVGFSCNVDGLIESVDRVSLIDLLRSITGNILTLANSRGGPVSKALCMLLIELGIEKERFELVLFGCPRCGDSAFKRNYNRLLGAQTTTINGMFDLIGMIPWWGYHHGTMIKIYTGLSHKLTDYLKRVIKNEQL